MAYSNWGGYAYKNGIHIPDRSDCTIKPDEIFSSPGMWPGFALAAASSSSEELKKIYNIHQAMLC